MTKNPCDIDLGIGMPRSIGSLRPEIASASTDDRGGFGRSPHLVLRPTRCQAYTKLWESEWWAPQPSDSSWGHHASRATRASRRAAGVRSEWKEVNVVRSKDLWTKRMEGPVEASDWRGVAAGAAGGKKVKLPFFRKLMGLGSPAP